MYASSSLEIENENWENLAHREWYIICKLRML